nr:hypothetical protein [Methylomagnum ishizawai]
MRWLLVSSISGVAHRPSAKARKVNVPAWVAWNPRKVRVLLAPAARVPMGADWSAVAPQTWALAWLAQASRVPPSAAVLPWFLTVTVAV